MNFGKLPDISAVDFAMPSDHPRTAWVLEHSAKSEASQFEVFLGATGWGNPEWLGKWYPSKTKPGDFLEHYSRQFNTIEFNTTHYRIPDMDLILRWQEKAASGFRFCPKVPQQISHYAKLRAPEPTKRFTDAILGLGEKLGPSFIQLPDHHGPRDANLILEFLDIWPENLPLHWEFRHPDWFVAETQDALNVWDALQARGHGTVITDVSGRRDVLHMQLTSPSLMLRFVGNGLHPTDYQRSEDWLDRIAAWQKQGLHSAWIFIHQPEMEEVPEFTGYWAKGLNERCGLKLRIPSPIPSQGIQGSLF